MPENPVEVFGEILGDMASRLGEYAAIWQDAARRNADNDYDVDDVAADMMRAGGMAARDVANMGAALLGALGSVARPTEAQPEAATARKKKKPAAKKTPVRRPPR
ncbi:MAG: hypothetical protein QOI61_1333 [Actinomycetota bacterium]|jgi:hypothetical protein